MGSDQTQTTAHLTQSTGASNSITPFHLAVEPYENGISSIPVHFKGRKQHIPDHNDDACSVTSRFSFATTTDGIDVLGAEESPKNFKQWSHWKAARIVSTVLFKRTVLFLILVCTMLLGARTIDIVRDEPHTLAAINLTLQILLVVFSVEMIVSVAFYQENIITAGWLITDIIIIAIAWWTHDTSILVLRSFRLLRALRKATGVPALKWAVKAVLRVLPRLTAVLLVLLPGMFAIFAILFTNLYQDAYEEDESLTENYFGRLDIALLTLFQIMTGGRNWSVISTELQQLHPSAWAPMVLFVAVSLFFFGSLIVAVMCDAVSKVNRDRLWKSLDQHQTNSSMDDSMLFHDTLVEDRRQVTIMSPQFQNSKQEFSRLERKLDDLTSTVNTLLRMQSILQESVNNLTQKEMARELTLLQRTHSSPITTASAATSTTATTKPAFSKAQSGDI